MTTGFPVDEAATKLDQLAQYVSKIKGISVQDALKFLGGKEFALGAQAQLMSRGGEATKLGRFVAGPAARNVLRVVPGLTAASAIFDVADVVAGQDSIPNKAMDAGSMAIGGTIGGVLGLGNPLAIMAGASFGKLGSDALQFLGGGGQSAEQRKLEEALNALRGGRA